MNLKVARALHRLRGLLGRTGAAELRPVKWMRSRIQTVTIRLPGVKLMMPKRFLDHYVQSDYEPVTQATFHELLRPGMVVIDVGAHIGYFTILSSNLVGDLGRVHSVEPCDENLSYLRRNVALNERENVQIYAYAAGKERAQRTFHITGSSDSHGFNPHPMTTTIKTIDVTEMPVDEIVSGRVDAVKIDVEGVEIMVLDGMSRILSDNPDVVLWVEWMPACMRNAGYDPLDLPRRLQSLGFANVEVLDDHGKYRGPVEEFLAKVASGDLPTNWYVNLLARRS